MSVLITAASHAEAYKLERILQLPDVIFADYRELPHLSFSGRKFMKIPAGNSASYAHMMLDLALNSGIEKIFPLYAEEIFPLAESRQLFEEYGISVMVPSVLWLKQKADMQVKGLAEWVVIEQGTVIAGTLPSGRAFLEEDLSGIFQFGFDNPALKLLTI
jgi:hypothetical protein